MTKATISDSVKTLLQKELVEKIDDPADTRSFSLGLTKKGKQIADRSGNFASGIEQSVSAFPDDQKDAMLKGLLQLIHDLNRSGVITIQRMCYNCSYYSVEKGIHYCRLLQMQLEHKHLRVDCPEYEDGSVE